MLGRALLDAPDGGWPLAADGSVSNSDREDYSQPHGATSSRIELTITAQG